MALANASQTSCTKISPNFCPRIPKAVPKYGKHTEGMGRPKSSVSPHRDQNTAAAPKTYDLRYLILEFRITYSSWF